MARRTPRPPVVTDCPAGPLPVDRLEWQEAWGMNTRSAAWVFRPTNAEGIAEAYAHAQRHGRTLGLRGAGRSYGDASLNGEGLSIDLTRMNRILEWDPDEGVIVVEPGVTIQRLWEYAIGDGWWPAVVPGTMHPTIGGVAGMNIHGKNNYAVGTFGEHILEFEMLLPTGERRVCSRTKHPELFHAAIGGFGVLGCFTRLKIQLKRVYSGLLNVEAVTLPNLRSMLTYFDENAAKSDYLVGWVDCFDNGRRPGRGVIHAANHLAPGEDTLPAQSLRAENQALPDTLFGFFPKAMLHHFMGLGVNDVCVRMVNAAKMATSRMPIISKPRYQQSHAAFAFLLDYVPNWKRAYLPGGLIQYQSFIPSDRAADVFESQIRLMHKRGLISYLGVLKKHRADPFLLTHGLDGFSLALDFRVTDSNRAALWRMAQDFDKIVVEAGGRLYFAKDSTMRPGTPHRFFPEENLRRFFDLKNTCDPEGILSTELFRRVFPREARRARENSLAKADQA